MTIRPLPPLLPALPPVPTKTDAAPNVAAPRPVQAPQVIEEPKIQAPPTPPTKTSLEAQRVSRMRMENDPAATLMQHRLGQLPEAGTNQGQTNNAAATVTGASTAAVADNAAQLKNFVHDVITNESQQGPWTSDDGMCLDLAAKWLQRLDQAGIPARLATVDPTRREMGTPVEKGMEGKFHAYVVAEPPGQEALIIDPTWRQFISEPKQGSEGQPDVFVGTQTELLNKLHQYENRLQIEVVNDPLLGNRKTQDVLELGYGFGRHAPLRELHSLPDS